jgi:hypothetical protein
VSVSLEEAGSQRMRAEGEYRNDNEHGDTEGSDHRESVMGFGSRPDDGRSRDLRWSWRQVNRIPRRLSWLGDFWLNGRNGCDEAVTRAGDCLHKLRQVRTVTKNLANFTDCRVDSVFDIDEDFPLPKAPGNFTPGNNLSVFGDQEDEKFERLPLKLEPAAFAAELKFAAMEAEVAELIDDKGHCLPLQRG